MAFIFAVSLSSCASMQAWCNPQKKAETPPPAQVVKAPEAVKPVPPPLPKKDRN